MKSAFAACFALALAQPAAGGAWLEKPGRGFASASATYRQSDGEGAHELGYYGAYGLAPKLTLGVDLNQNADVSGHALLFARLPLWHAGRNRLAAEAGIGGNHFQGSWQVMQKTALSFGRSFRTRNGSGWLAIDAAYELRNGGEDGIWKLDAALGLRRPGKFAPMLQIETSRPESGELSYAVTPSLRYALSPRQELVLGLEHRRAQQRSLGLKLSLWQRF